MDEESDYQDTLQENFSLFCRYIVPEDFFETLISERVLSVDDTQIIANHTVNQNRRQRAYRFLEILMTKGQNGFDKFLGLLEYSYPHVYQEVTKKEPRYPPETFQVTENRQAERLRIIDDLPKVLEQIKDKYLGNVELETQLSSLHCILTVSQEENDALEKELKHLESIRQENGKMKQIISELNMKNKELADSGTAYLEKAYKEQSDNKELVAQNHNLQVKCAEIERKLQTEMNRRPLLPSDRHSSPLSPHLLYTRTATDHPHTIAESSTATASETELPGVGHHVVEQQRILQDDLDNYKSQCEDLASRLQTANDITTRLESDLKSKQKLLKELEVLRKQLREAKAMQEHYFNRCQENQEEVISIELLKSAEQEKVLKLKREKKTWSEENFQLKKQLGQAREELDVLRCRLRESNSSLELLEGSSEDEGVERRKCVYNKGHLHSNRSLQAQEHVDDDDDLEKYRASTLQPTKATDTPDMLFQRELAHFRYTHKRKLNTTSSMQVQISMTMDENNRWRPRTDEVTGPPNLAHPHQGFEAAARGSIFSDDTGSSSLIARAADPFSNRNTDDADSTAYIRNKDYMSSSNLMNRFGSWMGDPDGLTLWPYREGKQDKIDPARTMNCMSLASIEDTDNSLTDMPDSMDVLSDFSCLEVSTQHLPRDSPVVTTSCLPEKDLSMYIRKQVPVLGEKLQIRGGNHTGIFISDLMTSTTPEFQEGDQIISVTYYPVESQEHSKVVADLRGCCLQSLYRLFSPEYIGDKQDAVVKLEIRRCHKEYEAACDWMNQNNGHGDFFYIRLNETINKDGLNLQSGDIFLVKNSYHQEIWWQGHHVNPVTGQPDELASCIPSKYRANILRAYSLSNKSTSEDVNIEQGRTSNRRAFKLRGQVYDFVLPMKAAVKLPVYLIGDITVVRQLLNIIIKQYSNLFTADSTLEAGKPYMPAELYRQDKHLVSAAYLEMMKSNKTIQRIIVLVNVTKQASAQTNSGQYGEDLEVEFTPEMVTKCKNIEQRLHESGQYFESLDLPSIPTREELLQKFKSCVSKAQDRMLWLSKSELDDSPAEKYSRYLGYPLVDIHWKLQRAMSQDLTSQDLTSQDLTSQDSVSQGSMSQGED